MSDDRDFDPRFDPAFQRGYDGVVDAAPQPGRTTPSAAAPNEPLPSAVPADEPATAAPVARHGEEPARRRNPFLIALLALSAVLIGGGLYLVVRMRDLFANTQSSTDFDFVTLQVLIGAAPIAIGLGVATVIGVLFVYSIRWDGSR